jgi:hypothetical protein
VSVGAAATPHHNARFVAASLLERTTRTRISIDLAATTCKPLRPFGQFNSKTYAHITHTSSSCILRSPTSIHTTAHNNTTQRRTQHLIGSNLQTTVYNRQFNSYLGEVPVCGCILLSPACDKMLMVRSLQGKRWSFPKGKVGKGERAVQCA